MPRGLGNGSDFEVQLQFNDGTILNEYKVEHHVSPTGVREWTDVWVESKPSRRYTILVQDLCRGKRSGDQEVMAVILFDGKVVERLAFGSWTGVHKVKTMNVRYGKEVWSCPLAFPRKADVGASKTGIGLITVKLYYGSLTTQPGRVEVAPAVSASRTMLDDRKRKSAGREASSGSADPDPLIHDSVSLFEYRDSATRHFHEFSIRYCNRDVLARELAKDDAAQASNASSSSGLRTVAGAPARRPRVTAQRQPSKTNTKPRTPISQSPRNSQPGPPRPPLSGPEPAPRSTPSPEPGPASLATSPAALARAEQSPSPSLSPYPTPAGSPDQPVYAKNDINSQDVKFRVDMSIPNPEPTNAASGSSVANPPSSASRKRPRRSSSARSDSSSSSSFSSSSESDASPSGGMFELLKAYIQQRQEEAKRLREAKKAKKKAKKAAKKKRREEKAERRRGQSSIAAIDLTLDSDGE